MARQTILNDELSARICSYIEQGNALETSALLAGVASRSLFNWIERGKNGEEPFLQFLQDVARARAKAEADNLAAIREAMDVKGSGHAAIVQRDWKARAWILERTNRERWGATVRVEIAKEFEAATERLRAEFADEPEILDRCLKAIAGEGGGGDEGAAGVASFLPPER